MPYTYNPLLKVGLDQTGAGGGTPGGSDTEIQYNESGAFAGSADLTWDDTGKVLEVGGDINLDDGGTYETTLQVVTPTAARTISFPDATGTVALVAGSSSQVVYNNAGAYAGLSTFTTDGTNITLTGRFISSLNGAASAPPGTFTGTWFTGGTSTTTKPQVVIEPTGTTSTAWSTSGTGIGVNAASGFAGNLLDLQVNGTSQFNVSASTGSITLGSSASTGTALSAFGTRLQIGVLGGPSAYAYRTTLGFYWLGSSSDQSVPKFSIPQTLNLSGSSTQTVTDGVLITRDADNILAQRNGTNAQTSRVYGTFTDASNYVRAALSSTSTAVTLAAETAGTGADDIPLNLTAAGTGTIKVNSVAEVVVSSTVAGLPAAPVVGMLTRVTDATAPAVGVTVVGGGAAAALCWYNGASWSVIGV
jgi:hypothetical protein